MISGNNRRGEKMLKKQQSLDRYGLNSMSSNSVKTTLMRNALSNEDLVDDLEKQELTSRLEDAAAAAKIAEEAYVANLKMLKKQKAKFLRLQKILSRNVILIPLCAVFSVLSAFTIFASTLTDHYELISYDVEFLRRQVEFDNNRTLGELNQRTGLNWTLAEFVGAVHARSFDPPPPPPPQLSITTPSSPISQADSEYRNDLNEKRIEMIRERLQSTYLYEMSDMIRDYYIVRRITYPPLSVPRNNQNSSIKMNILYETHSGIWKLCNYLSNQSRLALRVEKCTFYKTTNIEHDSTMIEYHHHHNKHMDSDTSSDPGRDLIRMHNAAACCTIVSYFLLVVSWITGLTAAFTKRVPVSMASWVLNLLTAVFLFLMLAIFHRKILIESKRTECLDLKIVFNIVCSSRTVKFGYSLGLTWLAFIFTTINAFCWMHITKMQKLLFVHGYYYN